MIDINKYPILNNHKSTLKETSKDNHDGNDDFMTESEYEVINFDDVKQEYVKELGLVEVPKSNDVLLAKNGDIDVFIEFKNGDIGRKEYDIRKKIYDSIFILGDIIKQNISYTREHIDYILVYNELKNTDPKTKYQESDSRDEIDKILLGYGNQRLIKCGVEIFQGYCFRNVYTYTKREFQQNFVCKL